MSNRHASTQAVSPLELSNPDSRSDSVEAFERAEKLLNSRIAKARREIRRVDLCTACCTCATLALAVLFAGVLCDCWIFSDGLSIRGRVFFIVLLIVVSILSFLWKNAPLLGRKVNALYAAKVLEETQQDRHNLTINWLQLCHSGKRFNRQTNAENDESSEQAEATRREALRIVALQAARFSKKKPEETAVDCSSLIRWGIAFASLVFLCSVYVILSPKSPFVSAGRIVAPTAAIERPQALRFDEVTPGDAVVFQGDFLEIEATISGAKQSQKVEILWETEDGRISNVAIPMESIGASRFKATLPEAEEGFSENLKYRVVAGRGSRFESASDLYSATVRPQPSFRVEKTTLKFPAYTGLPPQTFENQGDVRAVENTVVEIVARATEKLQRAYLLPDGDQTRAIKMSIHPEESEIASTSFTLQWNDAESQVPIFSNYTLLSEDVGGEKNRDAQLYDVSILADQPPTIRWESDSSEVVRVPLNDVLHVSFIAEDPDYALRRAELHIAYNDLQQGDQAEQKPNPKPIEIPLSSSPTKIDPHGASPYVGSQTLRYALVPEKLGLNVGDELEYWGVVFDSKTPDANVGVSEKRVFIVVDPVANPTDPNDERQESAPNENSGEGSESSSDENQKGGVEGSESSSKGDAQNENGTQGETGENQQENSDQSGEETESSASNDQNESGADAGETTSEGEKSQNQTGAGAESGSASGSQIDESQGGEGSKGADGEESDNGEESDSSESAASSSNESTSGNNSTSDSENGPSSESSNENSGSDPSGDSAGNHSEEDAPSSDEAFQKILDFMNANQSSSAGENADSEAIGHGDQKDSKEPNQRDATNGETEGVGEAQEEAEPNFEPSDKELTPQEKMGLPTRTSPDKPSEDAPSFQAENPEKIDPNSRRRQGDVDPNSNDFLGQNADPDQQERKNTSAKGRDPNILLDPLDQKQGVAADSVDQNAPEAKGVPNNIPEGGKTEIDRDQSNSTNQSSTSNQDFTPPSESTPPSAGAEGQSGDGSRSDVPDARGGGDSGNVETPNSTKKKGETPTRGGADELGAAHGGGGAGSGLGEIEQGEERLAPADAPRLRYAEKATNLVLEYLEDSLKGKVDKRLLKELDWTEEEARAFLDQWKKMRDAAFQDDDARDQYLEALKNVALEADASLDDATPIDSTLIRDFDDSRSRGGTREASRLKTPDRLSERVKAFTRGVSSGSGGR